MHYQKDTPQEPPPPNECNAKRQRTQHQVSLYGRKINWYFHSLPPQDPIALPNQNQNLKLWPLQYTFRLYNLARKNVSPVKPLHYLVGYKSTRPL